MYIANYFPPTGYSGAGDAVGTRLCSRGGGRDGKNWKKNPQNVIMDIITETRVSSYFRKTERDYYINIMQNTLTGTLLYYSTSGSGERYRIGLKSQSQVS